MSWILWTTSNHEIKNSTNICVTLYTYMYSLYQGSTNLHIHENSKFHIHQKLVYMNLTKYDFTE